MNGGGVQNDIVEYLEDRINLKDLLGDFQGLFLKLMYNSLDLWEQECHQFLILPSDFEIGEMIDLNVICLFIIIINIIVIFK